MRTASLFFVLLLLPGLALAQSTNNYGSVYSRFGLGEPSAFTSPMAETMGGAGTALRSPYYNGLANPALWADLTFTDFAVAAQVRGLSSTAADDATARATAGGLDGLALGLPLIQQRLGLTVAFRPYSRVNYRAVQDGEILPDEGDTPVPYRVNFEGNGGLHQITAGLGARLSSRLRVGASVDARFGVLEYLQRTEFPGNAAYLETRTTRSTQLSGVSATLGAVFTVPGLVHEGDGLHLGAAVTLPTRLSGERVRTLGVSLDRDTLFSVEEGSVTLPLSARAGVAYSGREHWTFAADAVYEPWSSFESDFAWGGFDADAGTNDLSDRLRVGAGVQVLPAGTDRTAGFFARTAYRLGAYTERAHVAPGGTDLTTYALTAGLSLPTALPTARLDLGIEAGTRGIADGVLVRDVFIRGTAALHFGERWFVRRRFR